MGTSERSGKPDEMLGVTCDGLASHPGGVAILLVASCYGNRDKLRLCGPLGSCADFTFYLFKTCDYTQYTYRYIVYFRPEERYFIVLGVLFHETLQKRTPSSG